MAATTNKTKQQHCKETLGKTEPRPIHVTIVNCSIKTLHHKPKKKTLLDIKRKHKLNLALQHYPPNKQQRLSNIGVVSYEC